MLGVLERLGTGPVLGDIFGRIEDEKTIEALRRGKKIQTRENKIGILFDGWSFVLVE